MTRRGVPIFRSFHPPKWEIYPVRAGAASMETLRDVTASSYRLLWQAKKRPAYLCVQTELEAAGGLSDIAAGRNGYADFLGWQAMEGPAGKNKANVNLSRGWALGTQAFKAALIHDYKLQLIPAHWNCRVQPRFVGRTGRKY